MALKCYRCGLVLDATPHGKGRDAVIKLASDHASKFGCGYPAANVDKLVKQLFPPEKKEVLKSAGSDKTKN
jgi:hypothetical protein